MGRPPVWTETLVLASLQAFIDREGRPPRQQECRDAYHLPSLATIRNRCGCLTAALVRLGYAPAEVDRFQREQRA